MAFRDIITKKILSIYEGEECGFLLGLQFKDKMQGVRYFVVADEEADLEYTLKPHDVLSAGEDYVTIRNKTNLVVSTDTKSSNINSVVVGIDGKNYGLMEDIIWGKNYKIDKILCKDYEFTPKNIINVGKNVIIVNNTERKMARANFAPQEKIDDTKSNTQTVEILPHATLPTPIRVNNTATLLGKRLNKDLMNYNGEIIARKNSVITIPIINSAKQFNIMAELIQNVKQ